MRWWKMKEYISSGKVTITRKVTEGLTVIYFEALVLFLYKFSSITFMLLFVGV